MTSQRVSGTLLRDLIDSFLGIRAMTSEEMARHGLSITHFVAMRAIEARGACTMSCLTECLDVTHGAGTGIIDRLAKLELVERTHSPQDRRVVQVTLTSKGSALVSEVKAATSTRFEQIISKFDESAQDQLATGLGLLADAFRSTPLSHDGDQAHAASR